MKQRILFLSGINDSFSLMAEAFLRHVDSRNFEAVSAGTAGQGVHPLSVEVMKEVGINLGPQISVEELRGQKFDFVISIDEVSAGKTHSLSTGETVHWKFENPLGISENPQAQRRAFQSVRDQIAQRIRLFAIVHARSERVAVAPAPARSYSNPVI